MHLEFTSRDQARLRRILQDFLSQTDADCCLVCDHAGHAIFHENVKREDPLIISALGAGVFAATRELARLLGEDEFSMVLHQGVKRSILIGSADEEILLVVLFSGDQKTGLVKLYTPAAAGAVRSVFDRIRRREPKRGEARPKYVLKQNGDIFGAEARE